MAAGTFTPSLLVDIQEKADRMWMDNMAKTDYIANVEAFIALRENQTANLSGLEGPKDRTISISWIQDCEIEATTCTTDCTIDGPELETVQSGLTIESCAETSFKVKRKAFRDNLYDNTEIIAKGLLKASKVLDENLTQAGIAFLNTNAGLNNWPGTLGSIVSGDTNIAALNWDTRLLPYLRMVAVKNRFNMPYMLSGENYWFTDYEATANRNNLDGAGDYVRNELLKRYYDLFNIEAVNDPVLFTYLLNRGAVAFASKAYWGAAPEAMSAGQEVYSVESRNLPGVRYDVTHTVTCVSDEYYDTFRLKAHYDFFLNPTGCVDDRTGILRFKKV